VLEDGPLASFGIHLDMNEDYALLKVAFLIMCFAYVGMSMGKWTARFMTTRSPHFAARVASDLKKESAVKAMGGKKAK